MKLFAVAISVDNEYAGRVLDLSWLLAKNLNDAERQVKAHVKRTFRDGREWGKWEDLDVAIEEAPTVLKDVKGVTCTVDVTMVSY